MIKKLRRKFIFILMTITTITMTTIMAFVIYSTWHQLESDCKSSLRLSLEEIMTPTNRQVPSKSLPENNKGKDEPSPEKVPEDTREIPQRAKKLEHRSKNVFCLKYDEDGQRVESSLDEDQDYFSYSEDELEEIASECLDASNDYGHVTGYNLAYMKKKGIHNTYLAFYDLTGNKQTMKSLCLSFAIAFIPGVLLFYGLSLFLGNWCISPIEKAWKQQQQFVADASHELKTPLTVILANTSMLKEENIEETKRQKWLSYIEKEANHMKQLVNDMLFLAKTDAVRESIQKYPVDFSELCMNSYLSFESIAFEKNIEFEADIDENLWCLGAADKLSQLNKILLDNACKYTEEGGRILMSLKKKGSTLLLQVNNSGTPIPKEQLPHLFERFYRVDEARTRSHAGYGLGLSIAQSITSLHQGKIYMTSSEDKGNTVSVELPSTTTNQMTH